MVDIHRVDAVSASLNWFPSDNDDTHAEFWTVRIEVGTEGRGTNVVTLFVDDREKARAIVLALKNMA